MKTKPNPAYKKAKPVSLSINFLTGEAKMATPANPPLVRPACPLFDFENGRYVRRK